MTALAQLLTFANGDKLRSAGSDVMRLTKWNAPRFIVGGNFLLFIGVVGWFGGDPMQGGLIDGRYYLGYHHRYVEVTQELYFGMSIYMSITLASVIVAAITLYLTKDN